MSLFVVGCLLGALAAAGRPCGWVGFTGSETKQEGGRGAREGEGAGEEALLSKSSFFSLSKSPCVSGIVPCFLIFFARLRRLVRHTEATHPRTTHFRLY